MIKRFADSWRDWRLPGLLCLLVAFFAWGLGSWWAAGLALAVVPLLAVLSWYQRTGGIPDQPPARAPVAATPPRAAEAHTPPSPRERSVERPAPAVEPADPQHLATQMLKNGRCALLLRPQIAANLTTPQLNDAAQAFDQAMSIVPAGEVLLESWRRDDDGGDPREQRDRLVKVDALYLDRYPVTNRQYQQFVDDGGYEQIGLWDPKIWPAVLDFVDQTGYPAPRFWREGRHPEGKADHPVVGVSWYEAAAFARWAGKRLPSDPEWVKAAAWPVLTHGTRPIQRRFPWGNSMDRGRAHVWGSGIADTVSVYEMPAGVSVGGAYHLAGNVWEWTTSDFGVWDTTARRLETPTLMKSIRGGAFDSYFETQVSSQFQSGECPIQRKRNIGFRCALTMTDVISLDLDAPTESEEPQAADACSVGAGEAYA